jgi:DNA-directed RNA polymerase specialized sigma24 family protein
LLDDSPAMETYEELAQNAATLAPLIVKALSRKYKDVPKEEIGISTSEALASYCEAARSGTLQEKNNPTGYMWSVGVRAVHRYLLHNRRQPRIGDRELEYDADDNAARYFEAHETLSVILSLIKNERYREMLKLHWLEELFFEEIAAKQKKSIKAVYNCHERAMEQAQKISAWLGFRPQQ